ncbi:Conotoxin superfamily T [Caenorhabditis elegans]|uniref:Conotoxin superfamily T n=1 Tax=Caenorhabditis elegans TaxID=6239 RepID=Q9XV72_CAEEL|nr:Conotoxin superfamily T [Caenorhabditis elegans]CAB04162.1 Conotoxin superfamily T [Caenorhabditis elegans]|eukprot:NP_507746.1 Uncharacterized protein CELE_F21D9.3 [Caenorhabditis elegans]
MYLLLTLLFVLFFSGSTLLAQCSGKKKGATSAKRKIFNDAPGTWSSSCCCFRSRRA